MNRALRRFQALFLSSLIAATGCVATPAPRLAPTSERGPWSALANLPEGESVVVGLREDAAVAAEAGSEIAAYFTRADADSLTVRRGALDPATAQAMGLTTFPRGDVRYVQRRITVSDPKANGTVMGLLIGTGTVAAIMLAFCTQQNDCPLGYASAVFVPIGGAAGAFWGRAIDGRKVETRLVTIYESP